MHIWRSEGTTVFRLESPNELGHSYTVTTTQHPSHIGGGGGLCTWPPRYQKEVIIEDEGAVQERQYWTRGQHLLSPSIVPSAILVRTNVSLEGRCGAVFLYKPEHRTHSVNLSCLESPCQWDPSQITGLLCVQVAACSILKDKNTVNNNKCKHSCM